MRAYLIFILLFLAFGAHAKNARNKKSISFKKIGQYMQKKDNAYKINLKIEESRVKLTRFCNSDTVQPSVDAHNSHFSNCLDDSRPASSERHREHGFAIQIQ